MKRVLLLVTVLLLLVTVLLPTFGLAHSGRTDGDGGHWDRSEGTYHYHHGYPAHDHPDGVCPYEDKDNSLMSQEEYFSQFLDEDGNINAYDVYHAATDTKIKTGNSYYKRGYSAGRQEGYSDGFDYGFERGRDRGYNQGWNDMVDKTNPWIIGLSILSGVLFIILLFVNRARRKHLEAYEEMIAETELERRKR